MNSVPQQVLLAVIAMAQATEPYAQIVIGALPADNSISMTISEGVPETTFMTKGAAYALQLTLNGKHTSAETVSGALDRIHLALTQARDYPRTGSYQITNIVTTSSPNEIAREENSQILYGSSLRVSFFYFKQ